MNEVKNVIKCTDHVLSLAEEVYKELGSGFKEDQTAVASYGEFNPDAVKLMDRVGWE